MVDRTRGSEFAGYGPAEYGARPGVREDAMPRTQVEVLSLSAGNQGGSKCRQQTRLASVLLVNVFVLLV